MVLRCLLLAVLAALSSTALSQNTVFINEFHYDDVGTDTLEGFEIAAPAGTDLSCYKMMLYNGLDSLVYDSLILSGIVGDSCNGFGMIWFNFPGIQNGPDGLALVHDPNQPGCGGGSMTVLQYISYEGQAILALDGPASGMTSERLAFQESGTTPNDFTLQLAGNGTFYSDFVWVQRNTGTRDNINNNQSFAGTGCNGAPTATQLTFRLQVTGCLEENALLAYKSVPPIPPAMPTSATTTRFS